MGQRFVPTETFEAEVNGFTNRYQKGKQYTVYDTPDHRDLAKKVQRWAAEGRVAITGVTSGAARPVKVATGGKQ